MPLIHIVLLSKEDPLYRVSLLCFVTSVDFFGGKAVVLMILDHSILVMHTKPSYRILIFVFKITMSIFPCSMEIFLLWYSLFSNSRNV